MPLRNLAWLLAVPALFALGLAVVYSAPRPDRDYALVRQFVDVTDAVRTNFYRKLSDDEQQQFFEDMVNGGLQKLDPHSQYLNAAQLKQFEADSQGSYGGVGIVLTVDRPSKFLKVDHPMPGTPAYESGVLAGDLIVRVDGTSTEGMTVPDARKLITGEPNTKVTLTVRRAGRAADEDVELTRAAVSQHPVSGVRRAFDGDRAYWEWFIDRPNGIAYIRLSGFNELTTKELREAIAEIERDGGKALILDLRDNPGGLLSEAVSVTDLFLSDGPIVTTRGQNPDKQRSFDATKDNNVFEGKPVVVLVSDQSASASEIVAAALQDKGRAVVVGERTYGKGSVQKLMRLGGDPPTAIKLTTETWWRPNGQNMDKKLAPKDRADEWGVRPDVEVPLTDLEKALLDWHVYKTNWVAGKPSKLGDARPTPPTLPNISGTLSGLRPLVTPGAPPTPPLGAAFEDKQLTKAGEVLRAKVK